MRNSPRSPGGTRSHRDWIVAFGPLALAEGAAGWLLLLTCAVALGLVFLGDLHTSPGGSVGAVGFIPVVAAAWLGSRLQTAGVALIGIAYRVAALLLGSFAITTA